MSFYRRNLPHLQRDFKFHFVTSVTKNRWILPDVARDIVLACTCHDNGRFYDLHAAVVMPDHMHLILTPLINDIEQRVMPLHEIMKAIKGASAHKINRQLGHQGTVWQEESFDRVLRSSDDVDAKILYVLENPVRQKLVSDWRQYRWMWHRQATNPFRPPQTT
jgi:REP element-mobilizing transposase RayT